MYLQKVICKKILFCCHFEGFWLKYQDPDPLVRGTEPRIRIRTKISRIRNTGSYAKQPSFVYFRNI